MCGITGFACKNPQPVNNILLMNTSIRHRGPDDEGYVTVGSFGDVPSIYGGLDTPEIDNSASITYFPDQSLKEIIHQKAVLAFGHRRLSIVDLTVSGHQPMCTSDRRYWIVYNGEVYNYRDLKKELQTLGYTFSSESDTEVILNAYKQWGPDCLNRFNGMWGFAIYDAHRESLFLARDRFGIKPLYYWVSPEGTFYFGSEIKVFTTLSGWKAELNIQNAYDFLVWGLKNHNDETMFRDVYQVPAGHYIDFFPRKEQMIPGGKVGVTKWYEITEKKFNGTHAEAIDKVNELLSDSIKLRVISEVPVGSCLSGGLDSSSIVCLINNQLRKEQQSFVQKTYSFISSDEKTNEIKWIKKVINRQGIEPHFTSAEPKSIFSNLEKITWHQDEPFGSLSIYAQWNVFALCALDDNKIMLDGQGADEYMAGYHSFLRMRFATLFKTGKFIRLWREIRQAQTLFGYSAKQLVRSLAGVVVGTKAGKIYPTHICKPSWLNIETNGLKTVSPYDTLQAGVSTIRTLSKVQLLHTNLPMLLHFEDRNSMAHSIEARVPFLDYRLVEFVYNLPDHYKIEGGLTKKILRESMSGILPDEIRDRTDKIGFQAPELMWMKDILLQEYRNAVSNIEEDSKGIIGKELQIRFENIVSGKEPFDNFLWRCISFAKWMKVFNVQN